MLVEKVNLTFEPMSAAHGAEIMDIFNYYIENSFAAYPEQALPQQFFGKLLEITQGYPAYAIITEGRVVGFCSLRAYSPFSTFSECAEISYFIHKDYTWMGIGKQALDKLESDARQKGIRTILASIASENPKSIAFHNKHGFKECGRFEKAVRKKDKVYDVVWMQKML